MTRKGKPRDYSDPSVIGGQLLPLGFTRYAEYLESDHWKAVRRRYRESDRPQRCGCGAAGRQLHHLTYARLGCEILTDLLLLCDECHRAEHGIGKPRRKSSGKAVPSPRKKKRPKRAAPQPVPRHLRPLDSMVQPPPEAAPRYEKPPKVGRGEPKPWEWDATRGKKAREAATAKR